MLLQLECIPCMLHMCVSVIQLLGLEEADAQSLFTEILETPALRGRIWDITSPDAIEPVMVKIIQASGVPDPFAEAKKRQNDIALGLYPSFQSLVKASPDPVLTAIRLAIAANAVDFMVPRSSEQIEESLRSNLEAPLPQKEVDVFRKRLANSKRILIFGDNSGEIVMDRLLIETIGEEHPAEIVYVVKSRPAMNDSMLTEARYTGMDSLVQVIENGMSGPFPGTQIQRCSPEVQDLVGGADLIISKGGGNFDSLDEEKDRMAGRLSFLLLSKCGPYHRRFGIPPFLPIVANY